MKQRLVCPVHHDVVLYEKNLGSFEFIVFSRTEYCKKCKKSYFEHECVDEVLSRGGGDDDTTER